MIGGQLGHKPVGKLRAVVVVRRCDGLAVRFIAWDVSVFAILVVAAGRGTGAAGFGFGDDVGLAAEAGFDAKPAVVANADEHSGLGFLLVRIDGQLGVEFGQARFNLDQAGAGFAVEFVKIANGVFEVVKVRSRVRRARLLRHRSTRAQPD